MDWIILALICAMTAGVIIHYVVKFTVSMLKKFRKRRSTKVVAAQMGAIAREASKNPNVKHVKFDELKNYDSAVFEYDPNSDEIIQVDFCEDVDDRIKTDERYGGGIVIYED